MPELPDLLYIQKHLSSDVCGRTIAGVAVKQPIVLRVAVEGDVRELLKGRAITACAVRGPFIHLFLSEDCDVILNLMLAGRLQHQHPGEKGEGHLCVSFSLNDGTSLNLCDDQKMAKAYVVQRGAYDKIPKFNQQGIDIRGSAFTLAAFQDLAQRNSRKQVRVFINDHTALSAIGNAYADEILFDAKIHPKTIVARLSPPEIGQLYHSILSVMDWGIAKVEEAAQPIHVKVRGHMKVRNRKGEPCPACGTIIRREGVRGYDVFFCPHCQSSSRALFIDWSKSPR